MYRGIPVVTSRKGVSMDKLQMLKKLSQETYQISPIGTLANLRSVLDNMKFDSTDDLRLAQDLVAYAHLAAFNMNGKNGQVAASLFAQAGNQAMVDELDRLLQLYQKRGLGVRLDRRFVDQNFRNYCDQHGLVILDVLQQGIEDIRRCSWVYLAWDTDGIIKVFKEVLDYNHGVLTGVSNREDELYAQLPENEFFPRFHGTIDIGEIKFIRQSVHFGQTLADYLGKPMSESDANWIISGVARALDFCHQHGIVYLDLKPENILVSPDGVKLLDLGISRKAEARQEVDIYLADPRFATYEGTTRLKASMASDFYQLSLLYHWLKTGKHPFDIVPFEYDDHELRESALLRFAWPTAILGDTLSIDLDHLEVSKTFFNFTRRSSKKSRDRQHNIVLFPARMGIPHKGHIEYISRLLELGYHVCVSLQRTHTLTDRDPIPKFLVRKMVAQSLIDRGFTPDVDFSFVFTPFFQTREEMRVHFYSMELMGDVVAVASSNPGIPELFPDLAVFDQASVFGTEGEAWDTRSWGEFLRHAIRVGDYQTFLKYAASGVEKILTFEEIRATYNTPQIEFAQHVEAILLRDGRESARTRVFNYSSPEESLAIRLRNKFPDVKVVRPYDRDTLIEIDDQQFLLVYLQTEFDPSTSHEEIFFELATPAPDL